jgi:hypothetical protein
MNWQIALRVYKLMVREQVNVAEKLLFPSIPYLTNKLQILDLPSRLNWTNSNSKLQIAYHPIMNNSAILIRKTSSSHVFNTVGIRTTQETIPVQHACACCIRHMNSDKEIQILNNFLIKMKINKIYIADGQILERGNTSPSVKYITICDKNIPAPKWLTYFNSNND